MIACIVDKSRFVEENKDLQFKLKGCDDVYYLNHLYEKDYGVISKFDSLTCEKITVYYVDHWTLLDPMSKYKHVARVVVGDSFNVIYTEF